jgi:prepilin-type N-terminal cleavage/methylation domain-containing protein
MAHALPRSRRGFSLVELLVVIAILAVVMGLTIPAILHFRHAAYGTACQNNLRQLTTSVQQYHDDHSTMPPYAANLVNVGIVSWYYYLQPYLDEMQPKRSTGLSTPYAILACPSDPTSSQDPTWSKTSYLANWYAFTNAPKGCFVPPQSFASLTNGLSNVVLFAECYSVCNKEFRPSMEPPYYHNFGVTPENLPSDDPKYLPRDFTMFQVQPSNLDCDFWRTQTPHSTMHAALADGSVRSVLPDIDPLTWKRALKPRTGQVPQDW